MAWYEALLESMVRKHARAAMSMLQSEERLDAFLSQSTSSLRHNNGVKQR